MTSAARCSLAREPRESREDLRAARTSAVAATGAAARRAHCRLQRLRSPCQTFRRRCRVAISVNTPPIARARYASRRRRRRSPAARCSALGRRRHDMRPADACNAVGRRMIFRATPRLRALHSTHIAGVVDMRAPPPNRRSLGHYWPASYARRSPAARLGQRRSFRRRRQAARLYSEAEPACAGARRRFRQHRPCASELMFFSSPHARRSRRRRHGREPGRRCTARTSARALVPASPSFRRCSSLSAPQPAFVADCRGYL